MEFSCIGFKASPEPYTLGEYVLRDDRFAYRDSLPVSLAGDRRSRYTAPVVKETAKWRLSEAYRFPLACPALAYPSRDNFSTDQTGDQPMVQELTIHNFQEEVLESAVPVLVDFWAPTCGPCRMLAPVLEQVAVETGGRLRIGKVNVFEQQDLAVHYRISAVPTLLVFLGGALVNTLVGYQDRRRLLAALKPALDGHAA